MQIIVLGMHRSGTSIVARLLNMMGAYFAPEGAAMPPTPDNPKGYWERNDIVVLNEGILANLGATWNRISQLDLSKVSEGLQQEFDKQAGTILQGLDANRPWMAKDPRFCLLLPLWLRLLEVPVFIYVYRNPIQIAQSLRSRDGFSMHFGIALWEKYTLQALKHSTGFPRILLSFHDIMADPVKTVKSLYDQLIEKDVQGLRLPSHKEILSFIDPKLFHKKGNENLQQAYINYQQSVLVKAFEEKTIFNLENLPQLSIGAADILQEYEQHFFEKLDYEQQITNHQHTIGQTQAQLQQERLNYQEKISAIHAEHEQQLQEKEQERVIYWQKWLAAEDRETQLQQQFTDLHQQMGQIEILRAHLSQQLEHAEQDLTHNHEELSALRADNQQQYEDLHKLIHWLEMLNHDLVALFNSQTWRSGDFITKMVLKLMLRAPGLTAKDHIKKITTDFFNWRIHNLRSDSHRDNRFIPAESLENKYLPANLHQVHQGQTGKKKIDIAALVALHNGEPSASASIRLIQPLQHPSVQNSVQFAWYTAHEYLYTLQPDVIVVQRHMLPHKTAAEQLVTYCQHKGIKLVYETDDDLYNIFKKRDIYGSYHKDALEALMVVTEKADVVITSSPLLQKQIQQDNHNTLCIPNALDEQIWLTQQNGQFIQPQPRQPDDKIRILYMGTKTHTEDLKIVKKAYQQIKEKYGNRVVLEIVGGVPDGTAIFGDVIEVEYAHFGNGQLDDYCQFVNWIREHNRWQLGIIPLQINEFNRKKTYIKFLDYAALGIAAICTNIDPYREVVRNGENGLLINNDTQAWYQTMCQLIEDTALRQRLATQAFQDLTQHHILQHVARQFAQPYLDLIQTAPPESTTRPNRGSDYTRWLRTYDALDKKLMQAMQQRIEQWTNPPLISIVMPTYNIAEKWLRAAIDSVCQQIYPHWELCIADDASTQPQVRKVLESYTKQDKRIKIHFRTENGHISAASNDALKLATGDYIALLDHDDLLARHALYWVAEEIIAYPDSALIYSDEDKINENNERFGAYFKSDWNFDLFLSHNLITHLAVYRADILKEIGGFRVGFEGAQDYDLALRVVERITPQQIRHIPRILYHWRTLESSTSGNPDAKPYAIKAAITAISEFCQRRGITARVTESLTMTGMIRVQYPLPVQLPLVSIIIPTYNQLKLLKQCVDSILQKTDYAAFEIIIVNNRSDETATLHYLEKIQEKSNIKVISYDQPFNYAAINNFAVEQAQGELICLLNNDIEVINKGWLSEMVSHAIRPDVGAVGARLWYPSHTLQHGGILLGVGGIAEHAHKGLRYGEGGYFGRAQIIQNFSAVTAACMVLRKTDFLTVGGLDAQHLSVAFNDIDLCLKLAEQGLRIVWTPYAELYHHESASRGYEDTPEKRKRLENESAYMQKRWGSILPHDPAYNPNLNNQKGDFSLAFPPRISLQQRWQGSSMFFNKLFKKFNNVTTNMETITPDREIPPAIKHRWEGYKLLKGKGLEIGALHEPAQIPTTCTIEYCDAQTTDELAQHFPELQGKQLVEVQHICDLDKQGLSIFAKDSYDFVIFNHVIEHVANPIKAVNELFRIAKPGGLVILSAPDKDFTFDKKRALTSFEHLLAEYNNNVTEVTDEHYMDFLTVVHPELLRLTPPEIQAHLSSIKRRREHAHVWNSRTFKEFLQHSFTLLKISAKCLLEIDSKQSGFEYFSVWQKMGG